MRAVSLAHREGVRMLAMAALALLLTAVGSPSIAQEATEDVVDAVASPPLADALRRFAKESGYDVVFPEALVQGKRAAPVRSAASPYEALTQMLAGSGLAPRFTRRDAFVLEPVISGGVPDMSLEKIEVLTSSTAEESAAYRWYGERLLQASLQVLRRSRELGLKTYDFTLYVWLSEDGKITGLEGYSVAEHQESLLIAKGMMLGLIVGTTPPVNMPQPVGLRIVAQ